MRESIRSGWYYVRKNPLLWGLLWGVSSLFWWLQQSILLPGMKMLLPLIPPIHTQVVSLETYYLLLVEGAYYLWHTPMAREILIMLCGILLIRIVLQPFLHSLLYTYAAQKEPSSGFWPLWKEGLPHLKKYTILYGYQLLSLVLYAWGSVSFVQTTGLILTRADTPLYAALFLLVILLLWVMLGIWMFSLFVCWRTAIAMNHSMYQSLKKALYTSIKKLPGFSLLMPILYFLLLQGILILIQWWTADQAVPQLSMLVLLALQTGMLLCVTLGMSIRFRNLSEE